jgi:hypothetical protein
LLQLVRTHRGWQLHFRPDEILLGDERVVGAAAKTGARDEAMLPPESRLPFLFYRDGIRSLRILQDLPKREAYELFDALVIGCHQMVPSDDLVTLLWQADLTHVVVEASPLEQSFYLAEPGSAAAGSVAPPSNASSGRVALAPEAGPETPRSDDFDDWPIAGGAVDVREAFERLSAGAEAARRALLEPWKREQEDAWDASVPELFRALVESDPREDTRAAFAHATATWCTSTIEQHDLARATLALQLLDRLDPDRPHSSHVLKHELRHVDEAELAEYLDEADPAEHGRFAALMVRLGSAAVPLAYGVMAHATRSRVRAAAATALCYQCAEHPELLRQFLDESRPEAMLNLVFVLGQIGGTEVAPMLKAVTKHADPRVRRQAVLSLGGVPEAERTPALLDELARFDPHILSTTLGMLARQHDENVTRFILELIADPEFEGRSEDVQRALFGALGEVADDSIVSALEKLLHRSHGWRGKRSYTQFAAALTLRRLGTPAARRVLEQGFQSKDASVRSACVDATNAKAA